MAPPARISTEGNDCAFGYVCARKRAQARVRGGTWAPARRGPGVVGCSFRGGGCEMSGRPLLPESAKAACPRRRFWAVWKAAAAEGGPGVGGASGAPADRAGPARSLRDVTFINISAPFHVCF